MSTTPKTFDPSLIDVPTEEGPKDNHLLQLPPIVPFIRKADFAVRSPWHVGTRRLLDYLLVYIQEGECKIKVEGNTYHCAKGDFYLIQPNDLHAWKAPTNTITPFAHLDIFYNPERLNSFTTASGQTDISAYKQLMQPRLNDYPGIHIPVKFVPSQPTAFRETLLKMIGLWHQGDIISQLEAQHAATELILGILKARQPYTVEMKTEPQSLNWITSYLMFHIAEPLTIADMASQVNLSPSRFSTLFRQRFGTSPHQYLLHLRIQHAQQLLKNPDLSVRQIAASCGFADVQHFTKTFKKVLGYTPKKQRP